MASCPTCSREVPADAQFCAYCAAPLDPSATGPTITSPVKQVAAAPLDAGALSSSDTIDQSRFAPGTMLTDRYRIVGLLGKGGMGEVYRADDLKLRQPAALKFLPKALTDHPQRLERFHHEVRVARQVSHPNVCRVYDIGESDGQPFISMEHIDGEDLASVLRRMGRPSGEKAIQIARQICAGLAAAHDKGVLHRDLKPHNIMIDGRGRVRITDFGLAGFVQEFMGGAEIRAGTPAYMAPEQLAGRGVSVKSDIYALGLIFYELFTGRRPFEGSTREELQRTRSTLSPPMPSSISKDMDQAVERVIMRCLESEPSARPSSALAVAAALPGGDPLAAALAAGETPSPEMVADASDVGGLRPRTAVPCLLGLVVGLFVFVGSNDSLVRRLSLPKPPEVLADRASELLRDLGHDAEAADSAYEFAVNSAAIDHIKKEDKSSTRWDSLADVWPPAMLFWHRQSPELLIPSSSVRRVTRTNPAFTTSGMSRVVLDPSGRLVEMEVVPAQKDDPKGSSETASQTDWSGLFEAAELDPAAFNSVEPIWTPTVYCDERIAWERKDAKESDTALRIEAGAYRGRPTFFKAVAPWTPADRMVEESDGSADRLVPIVMFGLLLILTAVSIAVARRNLRLGRSDRVGAGRFALVFLIVLFLNKVLAATHVPRLIAEFFRNGEALGEAMLFAASLWLLYIAVEPYVRRYWPQTLISWSRLLMGRFRDPSVGRDVLIGGLAAIVVGLIGRLETTALLELGAPPEQPATANLDILLGGRHVLHNLCDPMMVWFALLMLFLLFVLKLLFRRQWLACGAFLLFWAFIEFFEPALREYPVHAKVIAVAFELAGPASFLILIIRFGLLAIVAEFFFLSLMSNPAFTLDFSVWYSSSSLIGLIVALAVAGYGFHTALAGRQIFKDELLES